MKLKEALSWMLFGPCVGPFLAWLMLIGACRGAANAAEHVLEKFLSKIEEDQ